MTPGEFQLYARGWLDANAPHGGPVTRADVKQVNAMREHSRRMREREKQAAQR